MANKPNPWDRAKSGTEHAEQSALIMWANMAANFGIAAADDLRCYTEAGYALATYGPFRGPAAVPALARLFAVHNQGHGDAKRGATAKAEGVKAGVPDLMLPLPVVSDGPMLRWGGHGIYCGLFIELKRLTSDRGAKGKASDKQDDWGKYLIGSGYAFEVCFGWLEARACILKYLGLNF